MAAIVTDQVKLENFLARFGNQFSILWNTYKNPFVYTFFYLYLSFQ